MFCRDHRNASRHTLHRENWFGGVPKNDCGPRFVRSGIRFSDDAISIALTADHGTVLLLAPCERRRDHRGYPKPPIRMDNVARSRRTANRSRVRRAV